MIPDKNGAEETPEPDSTRSTRKKRTRYVIIEEVDTEDSESDQEKSVIVNRKAKGAKKRGKTKLVKKK